MSFFVNNVELKEATFNQQEVKSIYFNTHLIWEAASWPGWANATWEDVYNLCKAKQEGRITAWPSDVVLGATKNTTLSTAVSGLTNYTMRIIGTDIDGAGVITFDCNHLGNNSLAGTKSDITNTCQNFYNYCDAKPYIKVLSKGTADGTTDPDNVRNGVVTYANNYVWLLSEREVNLDKHSSISVANSTLTKAECTYGVNQPYPYFTSNETRIKKKKDGSSIRWSLRSEDFIVEAVYFLHITETGTSSISLDNSGFSPCFAIG